MRLSGCLSAPSRASSSTRISSASSPTAGELRSKSSIRPGVATTTYADASRDGSEKSPCGMPAAATATRLRVRAQLSLLQRGGEAADHECEPGVAVGAELAAHRLQGSGSRSLAERQPTLARTLPLLLATACCCYCHCYCSPRTATQARASGRARARASPARGASGT